jgi:hypothetical protein
MLHSHSSHHGRAIDQLSQLLALLWCQYGLALSEFNLLLPGISIQLIIIQKTTQKAIKAITK